MAIALYYYQLNEALNLKQLMEIEQVFIHDLIRNWNEIYGDSHKSIAQKIKSIFSRRVN